jgi:hypothetical protein
MLFIAARSGPPFASPFSAISMACGVICEPFPVLDADAPVTRRQGKRQVGLWGLSEKQYTGPSLAWQEIVDFFASALPAE